MKFNIIYTSDEARAIYEREGGIKYATPGSCAFDVRACLPNGRVEIPVGGQALIPLGFKICIAPEELAHLRSSGPYDPDLGIAGILLPRSGSGSKRGMVLGNTIGLIDTDYQGEVMAMVWHRPTESLESLHQLHDEGGAIPEMVIEHGERIAQYMIVPTIIGQFTMVTEFPAATDRGEDGFGSTGK